MEAVVSIFRHKLYLYLLCSSFKTKRAIVVEIETVKYGHHIFALRRGYTRIGVKFEVIVKGNCED